MENGEVLSMPAGFLWGVATAAHQNEGGNRNNQWAAWEAQPGRIHNGGSAQMTTDWWNLESAAADFDRAAELGLNSLRLSVEWSRIEPEPDVFDPAALERYRQLIALLRSRNIKPMVSLHHFTDPLWLTAQGGWENPQVVDRFAAFVARVVEALGDQVTLWCTVNEPNIYAYLGYLGGPFPPGVNSLSRTIKVMRHMLLAHGRAYHTIHRLQPQAEVGLAHHMRLFLPANSRRLADRLATAMMHQVGNVAILEAITHGRWTPLLGFGVILALYDVAEVLLKPIFGALSDRMPVVSRFLAQRSRSSMAIERSTTVAMNTLMWPWAGSYCGRLCNSRSRSSCSTSGRSRTVNQRSCTCCRVVRSQKPLPYSSDRSARAPRSSSTCPTPSARRRAMRAISTSR